MLLLGSHCSHLSTLHILLVAMVSGQVLLCACIMLCMVAYVGCYNMLVYFYVCILRSQHILSTPLGECDIHKGTKPGTSLRGCFSQHISPSAFVGCWVHNAHAYKAEAAQCSIDCGRLALLPSKPRE